MELLIIFIEQEKNKQQKPILQRLIHLLQEEIGSF
jgi:mannitol/fructose-specific phosphotransferase system IIA component (Ntr-type)